MENKVIHQDIPTMIKWIIGGRCTENQVLRVTHLSTIPTLGNLTLKFLWDLG